MRAIPLLFTSALFALAAAACSKRDAPPQTEPPGAPKKADTKTLELGAETLQSFAPLRRVDAYLDGFHAMKDRPDHVMEAHHYCSSSNEELMQCVLFDGNGKDANLIGVEYIVSESLFQKLAPDEKPYWHPHNFEILSGQLVAPGLPDSAEKAFLKKKMNSYGKTWHVWDTGHSGHPGQPLPVGAPQLAWSFNADGEAPQALIDERDRRMGVSTPDKRKSREDLAPLAHPQEGTDALKAPRGPRARRPAAHGAD